MKMLFCTWMLVTTVFSAAATNYQTWVILSSPGKSFQHRFPSQLLSVMMSESVNECASACHRLPHCRTFDYDPSSKQCCLFEADSTTGTILPASSPTSVAGFVELIPDFYSPTHGQVCSACEQSRDEVCSSNTSTCQCPPRTYWNGHICRLQLFENDTCTHRDACRSDLNLTCALDCYGEYHRCVPETPVTNRSASFGVRQGITVAGGCTGNASTTQTRLSWPSDILLVPNGTLYMGDYDGRLLAFDKNNRTGRTVAAFGDWPGFMYLDNRTAEMYVSVVDLHLVYVLPSNRTIPPDGLSSGTCSRTRLRNPTVVITDSIGNVYISCTLCHYVMKWAPYARNGTVVAGSSSATAGSTAQLLSSPYGLALDEPRGFLYVADYGNSRIQRFYTNGSSTGFTVAGGSGVGTALNQFNGPTEILLSRIENSIFTADRFNNRVQKWLLNSSTGVTIAGSSTGLVGKTAFLMDGAYAVALSDDESFLYVTDTNNFRIQRYELN